MIRLTVRIGAFLCAVFIFISCGSVPLTGRRQVLLVSDQEVFQAGLTQYNEYMASAKLSGNAKASAMVRSVGSRLAAATENYLRANGLEYELSNFLWDFSLVESDEVNAFCLPGGKIVVYEGLLTVARTESELAVVLGHEIGHAVAKHSNERLSQEIMAQYGMAILSEALSQKSVAVRSIATSVFGLGAKVGVMLPYSRRHEYEADFMGIVFMEMAGYDSTSAIDFWTRMSEGSGDSNDFFSTHPSDGKRINQLQNRIPEAKAFAKKN